MSNVLIVDDDRQLCQFLTKLISKQGHTGSMAHSISDARAKSRSGDFDLVLLDLELPDGNGLSALADIRLAPSSPEVIIITGTGNIEGAELAFKYGAWDFIPKPPNPNEVILSITRALEYRDEKQAVQLPRLLAREGIVGESPALKTVLELVAQAAANNISVLITGETGTGKEVTARAIHGNSARTDGPFIVVDCASLPESLIESSLFGHEKGAFTGATEKRAGLIKQAESGTLFLDEVGELPPTTQKKFLRVLQEHRFRPVGGVREVHSDFRLIAATNRDLDQMIAGNNFRQDLLYRLRSLSIHLPALCERPSDIMNLTLHHLKQYSDTNGGHALKGCSPDLYEALMAYNWPGNIRELFNALDHALSAAGDSPTLHPIHLPPTIRLPQIRGQLGDYDSTADTPSDLHDSDGNLLPIRDYRDTQMAAAEQTYLMALMRRTGGNIKQACEISGLSKSRLLALLKKYDTPRFRESK